MLPANIKATVIQKFNPVFLPVLQSSGTMYSLYSESIMLYYFSNSSKLQGRDSWHFVGKENLEFKNKILRVERVQLEVNIQPFLYILLLLSRAVKIMLLCEKFEMHLFLWVDTTAIGHMPLCSMQPTQPYMAALRGIIYSVLYTS